MRLGFGIVAADNGAHSEGPQRAVQSEVVHVPSTDKEKKQRNSELRGQVSVNWRWKETQEEFAGRPEEEEEEKRGTEDIDESTKYSLGHALCEHGRWNHAVVSLFVVADFRAAPVNELPCIRRPP